MRWRSNEPTLLPDAGAILVCRGGVGALLGQVAAIPQTRRGTTALSGPKPMPREQVDPVAMSPRGRRRYQTGEVPRTDPGQACHGRRVGCSGYPKDCTSLRAEFNFGPRQTRPRVHKAPGMDDHGSAKGLLDGVDPSVNAANVHFLDAVGVAHPWHTDIDVAQCVQCATIFASQGHDMHV